MSEDTEENAQLVTLSRPDSHLIPLRAKPSGKYVTAKAGKFEVTLDGLYSLTSIRDEIFRPKLKESKVIFSRFVYIGTVYRDGSSLPFIPISSAKVRPQPSTAVRQHNYNSRSKCEPSDSNDQDTFYTIEGLIPESIWQDLHRSLSRLPSLKGFDVRHEVLTEKKSNEGGQGGNMSRMKCHVKADREVTTCLNGIWFTKPLKKAMVEINELRGNIFLMPKCTRSPASDIVMLSFEIYGMWVTEDLEKLFGPFHWQKVIY